MHLHLDHMFMVFPLPEMTLGMTHFCLSELCLYLRSLECSLITVTQHTVNPLCNPPKTTLALLLGVSYYYFHALLL